MRYCLPLVALVLLVQTARAEQWTVDKVEAVIPDVVGSVANLLPEGWAKTFDPSKVAIEVVGRKEFRRIVSDFGMEITGANSKDFVRRTLARVGAAIGNRLVGTPSLGMYLPGNTTNEGTLYLIKEDLSFATPDRVKGFIAHELTHAVQHQARTDTYVKFRKLSKSLVGQSKTTNNEYVQLRMVTEGQALVVQMQVDPGFRTRKKARSFLGRLTNLAKSGARRIAGAASSKLRNVVASYSLGTAIGHPALSEALLSDSSARGQLLDPVVSKMNKVSGWHYLRRGIGAYEPIGKALAADAKAVIEHSARLDSATETGASQQQTRAPSAKPPSWRERLKTTVGSVRQAAQTRLGRFFKRR